MERQYVGIDLHRHRSVIVRMDEAGEVVSEARIDNERVALAAEVAKAGDTPEVGIEATVGWYWAVDVLEELGARVHLAHPLGIKAFDNRRVKNDRTDARLLADLLRMNRLPEGWIAPKEIRELRELVRYRHNLVDGRSGLKAQVHGVLAKEGVRLRIAHVWGPVGSRLLDDLDLADAYCTRVESLRDLVGFFDREVAMLDRLIAGRLANHVGYRAIQAIPGVGPVLAAVFVAEVGDVGRFLRPQRLVSWAGLTPRHRESDAKVRRGRITKMACGCTRLSGCSRNRYGGDREHLGRHRHPSSPADLRLCRPRHRRGEDRPDRPGQSSSAARGCSGSRAPARWPSPWRAARGGAM